MTTWDLGETRELVAGIYDEAQTELAYQSMSSTIDCQEYARYHFIAQVNCVVQLHGKSK